MGIFRGTGGTGDSTTDTTVTTVTEKAAEAASSATSAANSATSAANSASSASTSATNAATSATNSATSASNASTSETNAATSASQAATSATNSASSATASASSASSASTSATNAATSATAAQTAETNAETAETNAETAYANTLAIFGNATDVQNAVDDAEKLAINPEDSQYTLSDAVTTGYSALHYAAKAEDYKTAAEVSKNAAETAETAAETAQGLAETAKTAAETAQSAAETAQAAAELAQSNAETVYDNFDDRYLGNKSGDPLVDNDNDGLTTGTLYFNTTENEMRVYTGTAWVAVQELSGDQTVNSLTSNNNVVVKGNLEVQGTTITVDSATAQTIDLGDNDKIRLGDSDDLQIYHDGLKSVIQDSGTGTLDISTNGSAIRLVQGNGNRLVTAGYGTAGVKLWYGSDDTEKLATTSTGVDITGNITVSGTVDGRDIATDGATLDAVASTYVDVSGDTLTGDLAFGDNVKAKFGAGNDLQIYHDGSNSYITDQGTGYLNISTNGNTVNISKSPFEYMASFAVDGAVSLYYDNSKKLATTSSGVDITGTVVADGLTVDTDTLYVDSTNNRVGIGTTSPAYVLDVSGSTPTIRIRSSSNNDTSLLDMRTVATYSNESKSIIKLGSPSNGSVNNNEAIAWHIEASEDESGFPQRGYALKFIQDERIDASTSQEIEAMRLTSDGRLGIGNVAPTTTLDVTGTVTADGLIVDSSDATLELHDPDVANPLTISQSDSVGEINLGSAGALKIGAGNNSSDADIVFYTKTTKTNRVRIDNDGDIIFYNDTGASQDFYWDASTSRLGIGTTSPSTGLHIAGPTGGGMITLQRTDSASGNGSIISQNSTGSNQSAIQLYNSETRFYSNYDSLSEVARIDSSGNLLVGGTNAYPGSNNVAGSAVRSDGQGQFSRDGGTALLINRKTSDGTIVDLRKDGTTIGYIGVDNTDNLFISGNSTHAGFMFGTANVVPYANGVGTNGSMDLGWSQGQFQNIYLSEGVRADTLKFNSRLGTEYGRFDSSGNLLVGTTANDVGSSSSVEGITLSSGSFGGYISAARSGGTVARLNRQTSDGQILDFRKDGTTVGSIGVSQGSALYIVDSSSGGIRFGASNEIIPCQNNGLRVDNTVNLGQASYRWKDLYLSGGVYLGGTGSANLLDDYEEGTFTPTFGGSTTDPSGITYDHQIGSYTKVGTLVQVTIKLGTDAITSVGSGNLRIRGLPFNPNYAVGAGRPTAYSFASNIEDYNIYVANGYFDLLKGSPFGYAQTSVLGTGTNANRLWVTFSYQTT